ncbi:RAMP superfamily CRISPR-associated protein [Thermoanaerobacter sp. CM-CNRG TB177]|uniref:RAMP superfamily CRISPR-associated protein n=1 Tax=Thermoanaerobacter sp. CM-CNRG TB177 TaxID=2800659 RepID=UPI001BDF628B|nr:RAMP superfamily CRISPR-associated protein [Thermoanaerobacter sp. CM-CNRG TB177]MBT1278893.1 hypothetical protein [Thermoanaerobacter sp. CM-CNRG TB177]
MIWYKLIFKQNQPIHIGSVEWGVINETEIFIPGWTMWGALTNQFLKRIGYSEIKKAKKLFEKITNFYPMIRQTEKPLFPEYNKGNFSFENYTTIEEFKYEFVDTIVSTAVEPLLRSAKDESLHEFEYILPKSKIDLNNKAKQLYWVGLIGFEDEVIKEINLLIKNDNNSEKKELSNLLKRIFSKIYIGGDTKYGFGEMELLDPINEVTEEKLSEWNITGNGTASIKPNFPLRQFFKFSNEIKFEGELKLLSEFDFTQNIPTVQEAGYFINVGSKVSDFNGIDLNKYHLIKGKFEKIK